IVVAVMAELAHEGSFLLDDLERSIVENAAALPNVEEEVRGRGRGRARGRGRVADQGIGQQGGRAQRGCGPVAAEVVVEEYVVVGEVMEVEGV
ncbi:Hypothetical predicted protein, partial [Paramuricea clavata]